MDVWSSLNHAVGPIQGLDTFRSLKRNGVPVRVNLRYLSTTPEMLEILNPLGLTFQRMRANVV